MLSLINSRSGQFLFCFVFQPMAPSNLLKNILSNTGRASVVKNDIVSN